MEITWTAEQNHSYRHCASNGSVWEVHIDYYDPNSEFARNYYLITPLRKVQIFTKGGLYTALDIAAELIKKNYC